MSKKITRAQIKNNQIKSIINNQLENKEKKLSSLPQSEKKIKGIEFKKYSPRPPMSTLQMSDKKDIDYNKIK